MSIELAKLAKTPTLTADGSAGSTAMLAKRTAAAIFANAQAHFNAKHTNQNTTLV
jgi:hypothetical protein